jgi:flagellin
MSLRINNNVEALIAHDALVKTSSQVSKSMERLSTGLRINRAADDAAGLAISELMRGQIRGLQQASRNIEDGVSFVQTAEGSLDEVHSMLQRIRELAVQYQNGTLSDASHTAIQSEVDQLAAEIERVGTSAKFNGVTLLDADGTSVSFQIGANDGEQISVALISLGKVLGSYSDLATATLGDIDNAINTVSSIRAGFGAVQNRLEHSLNVAASATENLTAAESRIRDVDMAEEMVKLTKSQILQQAGTAMLSQANQEPQSVLNLLKG